MMAVIKVGRNINSILYYHFRKISEGKADLITVHGFGGQGERMDRKELNAYFRSYTLRNNRVKVNAIHIFLHFSQTDSLDKRSLRYIAQQYMKRIGYGKQPYVVFNHTDSYKPHIHVLSTTISKNGKRLETHHLGKTLSKKACRELVAEMGRHSSPQPPEQHSYPARLEKLEYGKTETLGRMESIIKGVLRQYTFGSIAEFAAVLHQFNVGLVQGKRGGRMWRNRGLAYCPLDDHGRHLGGLVKASSLSLRPTFGSITNRMERNKRVSPSKVAEAKERFLEVQDNMVKDALMDLDGTFKKNGFAISIQMGRDKKRAIAIDHLNRTTFTISGKLLREVSRQVAIKLVERYPVIQEALEEKSSNGGHEETVDNAYRKEEIPVWKLDTAPEFQKFVERVSRLRDVLPKQSISLPRSRNSKFSPNRS
ncbi:relaxase/mobilization nuclease domain-containing protein [Echinicola vietnamensis]|uniref:Relaxase/mobilization nuclease n=1 Tax=Echinicola vietnamensis (strain DSM 17526 / LMG 23754 / KMM 6221) TaxID=926556 RepID=L0G6F2_ECHVK|nr:relaxase/mobilization nuclease domain-containing protein [Echinicola vietnamensis]AGA80566.1 relaxase/mobilization nuclease [Echinicola vietnamensis DSM 17526]